LLMGAAEGGHYVYMGVLLASSLLAIGYLMPVFVRGFFFEYKEEHGHGDGHGHDSHHEQGEAPLLCVLPPVLTAGGCVLLFIFSAELEGLIAPIAKTAAAAVGG